MIKNTDRLLAKLDLLALQVLPQAAAAAVNRVSNTIKSRTAKDIAHAGGFRISSVRRRIVFKRRAQKTDPRAVLSIKGSPFNLVEFVSGSRSEPRRPRIGITARPWGRGHKFPGVFLARMPNGQIIAVERSAAGRAGKKIRTGKWAGKSPHIRAVFGAGIAREAAAKRLAQERSATMLERMPIELKHELVYRISRLLVKGR